MKSKFFIYVLPLILGVVATILMLNAPQPQKGVPKKPVASAPSASVPPVIPEVAENKEEATKEEAAEDEKTEEAEQTEETEETEDEETEEAEETVETDKLREAFVSHAKTISQNELWLEFIARDDALLRCVKAVAEDAFLRLPERRAAARRHGGGHRALQDRHGRPAVYRHAGRDGPLQRNRTRLG